MYEEDRQDNLNKNVIHDVLSKLLFRGATLPKNQNKVFREVINELKTGKH